MVERITSRRSSFVHGNVGGRISLGLGLRGCERDARLIRPRTGLRWARSTDADGEGDVRENPDRKICTASLDKLPLIDGFVCHVFILDPNGLDRNLKAVVVVTTAPLKPTRATYVLNQVCNPCFNRSQELSHFRSQN